MTNRLTIGAVALCAGLLTSACDDHGDEDIPPVPTIEISIDPTTVVSGETTTLSVTVTDFELRDPASVSSSPLSTPQHEGEGTAPSATAGHYHVYIDTLDENPLLMAWDAEVELTIDATEGEHEIFVRLNDDSHRILEPEVLDSTMITVTPAPGS